MRQSIFRVQPASRTWRSLIQSALNAAQPTEATTTGSSIAPESASFTGSIEGGLMVVTAVSSGQIAIGGILTSANGYYGQIIAQDSGTPGGEGVYNVWYGAPGNRVICPARHGAFRNLRDFDDRHCQFTARWPSARRSRATVLGEIPRSSTMSRAAASAAAASGSLI